MLSSVTDVLGHTGQAQASLWATAKPAVICCSRPSTDLSLVQRAVIQLMCLYRFLRWRMLQESRTRSPDGVLGKEIGYSYG